MLTEHEERMKVSRGSTDSLNIYHGRCPTLYRHILIMEIRACVDGYNWTGKS